MLQAVTTNQFERYIKLSSIEKTAQELKDLCQPLTHLNITTFSHIRSYPNQQFNVLCNNSKFLANYFAKHYYDADPCVQIKAEPTDFGQFLMWDMIEVRGQTAAMLQDSADLDFKHVFTIIKHQINCTEFYHFGTHFASPVINQSYINNIELLDKFIHFFRKSVTESKFLSSQYSHCFTASPHNSAPVFQNIINSTNKNSFLKAISSANEYNLSNKELVCAKLILKGMTAKEIAKQSNQSYRTVEHRIEGLKTKLFAKNKIDLAVKLKELFETRY